MHVHLSPTNISKDLIHNYKRAQSNSTAVVVSMISNDMKSSRPEYFPPTWLNLGIHGKKKVNHKAPETIKTAVSL